MKLRILHSIVELRDVGTQWDNLWLRSEVALPTLRAEQVALWVESFAFGAPFRALVIEDSGRFVAALPMVDRRRAHLLKTGSLPTNLWSASGDLLLDPTCDVGRAADALVDGIARGPWPIFWFDLVPLGLPRWQTLIAAIERRGLAMSTQSLYTIGQVEFDGDWTTYEATRSRNHRQQTRKLWRRIEREGVTQLIRHKNIPPVELALLLRRGFEVEDRSWKAHAGTSVLRTPGAFEFYLRQAELLNASGELQLVTLEHQGRPIAFEYGWLAKQNYFSPKVGYDEEFSMYRPGQLLRAKLYEEFFATGECRRVDYLGPLSDATRSWSNRKYTISRLVIAGSGRTARWGLRLIETLQRARSKSDDPRDQPLEQPTPDEGTLEPAPTN